MLTTYLETRAALRDAGLGPIAASVHAPVFWLVGFRERGRIAALLDRPDPDG